MSRRYTAPSRSPQQEGLRGTRATGTPGLRGHPNSGAYAPVGRLQSVTRDGEIVESYTYDGNGNRTAATLDGASVTADYDDQDRLLRCGDTTYTHDRNGTRTAIDAPGTADDWQYDFDPFGRLRAATSADTAVEYGLDALGRRVNRSVNGQTTHRWVYKDALNPVAELDEAGTVITRYIYGANPFTPQAMIRDGIAYRIVSDMTGSVRLVVNAETGDVAQQIDYNSFGRIINDTNPGFQPFGFQGGLHDRATDLVRFGAREYDPTIGRWLSKDPIGFAGRLNHYVFCANNPANRCDPSGLCDTSDNRRVIPYVDLGLQGLVPILGCGGPCRRIGSDQRNCLHIRQATVRRGCSRRLERHFRGQNCTRKGHLPREAKRLRLFRSHPLHDVAPSNPVLKSTGYGRART